MELLALARTVPLSNEQDRILTAAFVRCENLAAKEYFVSVPTNAELAKKYAVSLRTVRYWRRAGCPFEGGQWRVLAWLATRRYVPAGTKTKLAKQLAKAKWRGIRSGLRHWHDEARRVKQSYKDNGIPLPPNDWLQNFRCPTR
jgi:hypothetical protein